MAQICHHSALLVWPATRTIEVSQDNRHTDEVRLHPTEGKLEMTDNIGAEHFRHLAVSIRDVNSHTPSSVYMTIQCVSPIESGHEPLPANR